MFHHTYQNIHITSADFRSPEAAAVTDCIFTLSLSAFSLFHLNVHINYFIFNNLTSFLHHPQAHLGPHTVLRKHRKHKQVNFSSELEEVELVNHISVPTLHTEV